MRGTSVVIGLLIAAAGVIFTLQGVGILPGSFMTRQTLWAILGPIIALIGLALAGFGALRSRAPKA
ncbi:MAG TPA: hypothetical protein VIG30_05115 [Ktedonobacterales bacterium]|jgi:hypothetical protein